MDSNSAKKGKVFIVTKIMRGPWGDYKSIRDKLGQLELVDVTSSSVKYRDDFSPMKIPINSDYNNTCCFENYWQKGKVFENTDREKQLKWWNSQTKGKRSYPPGKGKKVLYAQWEDLGDYKYKYIESRKKVYVPKYWELIENNHTLCELIDKVNNGVNVAVVDYDGPKSDEGNPLVHEISIEYLQDQINDSRNGHQFGHGYIVAGAILGILPHEYIDY